MLNRSALLRVLSNANRLFYRNHDFNPIGNVKIKHNCIDRKLTSLLSRSLCSDSKSKGSTDSLKSPESKKILDEDVIEVLDVEEEQKKSVEKTNLSGTGFEVFKDEDSPVIFDVEEERLISLSDTSDAQKRINDFKGVNLERGTRGVFDVEELVSILKRQNAADIVVIEIPVELGYADHMIIVTGKSKRHLQSIATYVRKLHKMKRRETDRIPMIEGERSKSDNWFALDLGNIILHIFSSETREDYDLESLWSLGSEFDPHLQEIEDPISAVIEKHSVYLGDLKPAENNG